VLASVIRVVQSAFRNPLLACLIAVFLACGAVRAAEPAEAVTGGKSGAIDPGLKLADLSGKVHALAEWQGSPIVLVFLATECPVSNGYVPELQRLADQYASAGVAFLGVHSDPALKAEDAARHASEYAIKFPVLLDPEQRLAEAVNASVTPQAIVLTGDGAVVYRGAIDDRYSTTGKRRIEPRVRYLQNATDAVLQSREVSPAETKPFGCPLPRK